MAEFFLRGLGPKGYIPEAQYHYIEQMLDGTKGPYFVTLFNVDEHNPVYSAYTIDRLQAAKLSTNQRCDLKVNEATWRVTPGLCCNFGWDPCTIYNRGLKIP